MYFALYIPLLLCRKTKTDRETDRMKDIQRVETTVMACYIGTSLITCIYDRFDVYTDVQSDRQTCRKAESDKHI